MTARRRGHDRPSRDALRVGLACLVAAATGALLPRAGATPAPPASALDAGAGSPAPTTAPLQDAGPAADRGSDGRATVGPTGESALLPPGATRSLVPSDEIFPPQTMLLRFDHRKHVKDLGVRCTSCHRAATTSDSAGDRLLPDPVAACDGCHGSDHREIGAVRGDGQLGRCETCHTGLGPGGGGKVERVVLPPANLRFSHRVHAARNIGCGQCHGRVGEIGLATRDSLPRMAGCVTCHDETSSARGGAKADCATCHLARNDGRLVQTFGGGRLLPPKWLRGAEHTADWTERHRTAAAEDSGFCASCHTSRECTDCHDGRVRPRSVHPNDFLSMHAVAARQDSPRCTSCHQEATFCADCHRRSGVARDGASGSRSAGRRFHPPASEWTTAPRGAQHHAWEAMRNLGACVSCHTERDCATCHATKGVSGGQGVSPHPAGFASGCGGAYRRNPRPCLVCHASGDRHLGTCR